MDDESRAVVEFMLEHLEGVSMFDAEFREHIVAASNRLYDITNSTSKEQEDG